MQRPQQFRFLKRLGAASRESFLHGIAAETLD